MKKRISERITVLNDKIPASCQSLRSNSQKLNQLASFCEYSYSNPEFNKLSSFNLTKEKTEHALASIIDNIYVISNDLVELLDLQSLLVEQTNFNLSQLAAELNIRVEDYGRGKINEVCANTDKKRNRLVILNEMKINEKIREENSFNHFKTIDYSSLDNIGHGVIIKSTLRNSCSMTTPVLNTNPSTPPLVSKVAPNFKCRSLYLTPQFKTNDKRILPPTVPLEYLNRQKSSNNILTSNNSASQLSQLSCDDSDSLQITNDDEYWISTNLDKIEYESSKSFTLYDSKNDLQPREESLDETLIGSIKSGIYEDPNFSDNNAVENVDDLTSVN